MAGANGASARVLAEAGAAKARWGDLRLRVLSAAVLLPVALACLWLGGWAWFLLMCALAVGLGVEWMTLVAGQLSFAWRWIGCGYIWFMAARLDQLRADPAVGFRNVLFLLVVVWAADIGAYAVGRFVGGPKLAPSISPGKTWSGAIGGALCSMLAGLSIAGYGSSSMRTAGVALMLAIASQLGDLAESAIKRRVGAKDSGTLLPGHGGLLDRLDGVLGAAPVAWLLAMFLGHGVELWR